MLKHVDLCSGIGGFALGFQRAGLSNPILFCDIEPWCRKVLHKHWPHVPIKTDVKELANDPKRNVPDCDILTAGYPCQPFSIAGLQKGSLDDRHIWSHLHKIIAQKRPTWCVFENVYGHIALGLDEVLTDLESEGYATRTFVVPACAVNAPHKRERLWIVGYSQHNGPSTSEVARSTSQASDGTSQGTDTTIEPTGTSRPDDNSYVAHTESERRGRGHSEECRVGERILQSKEQGGSSLGCQAEGRSKPRSQPIYEQDYTNWWSIEPEVGRVANGVSDRVDRLKGLGNAIVPQIAQRIGEVILSYEYN